MKQVFAGTFVAAAFAVGLSAQPLPAQSQPMQEAKDATKSVTVTGCLKVGELAETYVLSDLKWADKAPAAVATSGVVTPTAPAVTATALNLVGSPSGTKLSDHVGHTVEVTGTIDRAMAPTTPPDAGRPKASFNVGAVKMIAATCPGK
jgi:hypothetical protein